MQSTALLQASPGVSADGSPQRKTAGSRIWPVRIRELRVRVESPDVRASHERALGAMGRICCEAMLGDLVVLLRVVARSCGLAVFGLRDSMATGCQNAFYALAVRSVDERAPRRHRAAGRSRENDRHPDLTVSVIGDVLGLALLPAVLP